MKINLHLLSYNVRSLEINIDLLHLCNLPEQLQCISVAGRTITVETTGFLGSAYRPHASRQVFASTSNVLSLDFKVQSV
jgi:hypothetical protein